MNNVKLNDNIKYDNNQQYSTTNNLNYEHYLINLKLEKFLNKNYYYLYPQKLTFSFINYILPFFCLKNFKNYQLLYIYSNIMYSYLSLEEILPSIERISRLCREDKNNEIISKTEYNNVFYYK